MDSSTAVGSPGPALFSIVGGNLQVSLDNGRTWTNVSTSSIVNGSVTTDKIADSAVTNAKLANSAAGTVKSNLTAGTAAPSDNTLAAVAAALPAATTAAQGMMTAKTFSATLNFGANLADADATIQPLTDKASAYLLPAGILTAGRAVTLGITGSAITTTAVYLIVQPQSQTLTIKNDTAATLLALAANTQCVQVTLIFLSGHFALSSVSYLVN